MVYEPFMEQPSCFFAIQIKLRLKGTTVWPLYSIRMIKQLTACREQYIHCTNILGKLKGVFAIYCLLGCVPQPEKHVPQLPNILVNDLFSSEMDTFGKWHEQCLLFFIMATQSCPWWAWVISVHFENWDLTRGNTRRKLQIRGVELPVHLHHKACQITHS